jgi:hypothetical protein
MHATVLEGGGVKDPAGMPGLGTRCLAQSVEAAGAAGVENPADQGVSQHSEMHERSELSLNAAVALDTTLSDRPV